MKILHLISSGGFYGAERVLVELAAYTRSRGYDVSVLAIDSPGAVSVCSALKESGVVCQVVKAGRLGLPGMAWWLAGYLRDNGIQIVHSHGYRTDVLAALAGFITPVTRIATCHTWYSTTFRLKLYEKIDKLALHIFDHVVVVSPQLRQEVSSAGLPRDRISLIWNGTDIDTACSTQERTELRERYGIGPDTAIILRVGRLDRDKGNTTLLEAFARRFKGRDLRLLFVGEGEEREMLAARAEHLGVAVQVVFAGYQERIAPFLVSADLFVISSYKEGLPIALLEAMAFGRAIIATDVGAIGSVIEHGRNGWLVPPHDAAQLADAMDRLCREKEQRRRLGEEALRSYRSSYTLKRMGECYLGIYQRTNRMEQ